MHFTKFWSFSSRKVWVWYVMLKSNMKAIVDPDLIDSHIFKLIFKMILYIFDVTWLVKRWIGNMQTLCFHYPLIITELHLLFLNIFQNFWFLLSWISSSLKPSRFCWIWSVDISDCRNKCNAYSNQSIIIFFVIFSHNSNLRGTNVCLSVCL